MTRKFEISANLKILTYNNEKYIKSETLANGFTVWKCKNKVCKCEIKTNKLNTRIVTCNVDKHNHSVNNSVGNSTSVDLLTPRPAGTLMRSSISPILHSSDSNQRTLNETSNGNDAFPDDVSVGLRAENEALRSELIRLRAEWDAVVQHSIESDTKLLLLAERELSDASTQTDFEPVQLSSAPVTSPKHVCTQTDLVFCDQSVQTPSDCLGDKIDLVVRPNQETRVSRLLTDDEILKGIIELGSDDVLIIPPSVCLNIILSSNNVSDLLSDEYQNKQIIIAPISNAKIDQDTGYNTPGTHWSLVVVSISDRQFFHLDSVPNLNDVVARNFCRRLNDALNFSPFIFKTKKCKRQSDGFSCGSHVIENAKVQVKLLLTSNTLNTLPTVNNMVDSDYNLKNVDSGTSIPNLCVHNVNKTSTKVLLVGDSHVRDLARILQPLMPQCDVVGYCYPGAPMAYVLTKLATLTKLLKPSDYVFIVGGTNNTSNWHLSRVMNQITNLCSGNVRGPRIVLTEVPHILVQSVRKRREIVNCNNKLYHLASKLGISFLVFGHTLKRSHYVKNGQHLSFFGKRAICGVICDNLASWLRKTEKGGNLNCFLKRVSRKAGQT